LTATVDPQPLRRLITPLPGEEFHALFSLKPFFKRLVPQPLRWLITPIGLGDKILNSNITTVFSQTF
jgi:hypothetical protein